MPDPMATKTTAELWEIVKNCNHPDRLAAIAEIENYRVIENSYSDPDVRGGISPTRRP